MRECIDSIIEIIDDVVEGEIETALDEYDEWKFGPDTVEESLL